jgi:hypothetical protein
VTATVEEWQGGARVASLSGGPGKGFGAPPTARGLVIMPRGWQRPRGAWRGIRGAARRGAG